MIPYITFCGITNKLLTLAVLLPKFIIEIKVGYRQIVIFITETIYHDTYHDMGSQHHNITSYVFFLAIPIPIHDLYFNNISMKLPIQ